MSRFLFPAIIISILGTGCQSETDAMRVICDAPTSCTECMKAIPDLRMTLLAKHINKNLSHRETRTLFSVLGSQDQKTKIQTLSERTQKLGITSCPLLDQLKASPPPAP